jgi:ech hydrogenase subunit C
MRAFTRSPWVLHYDASSCNGCDIEVVASLTPLYDLERLGILNTGNPKHADIFLVTGSVNAQNVKVIQTLYEQMPEPRAVVALGTCATSGCVFRECYNVMGGVDTVLPVDVYVPGCAVRPESVIDGILKAAQALERKRAFLRSLRGRTGDVVVERAFAGDAAEILALQKIVFQNEAEMYGDYSLTPLQQTLDDLHADFRRRVFLKAVVGGKIVGSIRGRLEGEVADIGWLIVHPYFWGRGIGSRLVGEIEAHFPTARRFETFMGERSRYTMVPFTTHGYVPLRQEKVTEHRDRVYFEKRVDAADGDGARS